MRRNLSEPGNAAVLEGSVRIQAPGDGALDDALLLLVQERDELALGADRLVHAAVEVAQEADDGGLLGGGRNIDRRIQE